jgi:CheY-like chemotaxis protein
VDKTQLSDGDGFEKEAIAAPLVSVVDDDDLMRRSIRRLLLSFGLRTEVFASAALVISRRLSPNTMNRFTGSRSA